MSWWWPFGEPVPVLFGYGLDRWDFLGTTDIVFETESIRTLRATLAFFVTKTGKRRSFKAVGIGHLPQYRKTLIRQHPFYLKAEQWTAGENSLWWLIAQPSDFLQGHMSLKFGLLHGEDGWYAPTVPGQSYEEADEETHATKPPKFRRRFGRKDNIMIVDFSKDKPK